MLLLWAAALEYHVYIAGPDVFRQDAKVIGEEYKKIAQDNGMIGHYPLDEEPLTEGVNSLQIAQHIAAICENMIDRCIANNRHGIMIANLTPFRGISMDPGTAHEIGYASALARLGNPMLIMGYTTDVRNLYERVLGGGEPVMINGMPHDKEGLMVENFGFADNLMMISAIHRTGGKVCGSFEEAIVEARRILDAKLSA